MLDPKHAWKTPRHLLPPGVNAGGPAIQTQGVLSCIVIERHEVPRAMAASRGGDYTATHVLQAIGQWMGTGFTPTTPRPTCALCQKVFESPMGADAPEAFFIAMPTQGNGDTLAAPVCRACVKATGSESLVAKAIEHFKRVWPKAYVTRPDREGVNQ
jgi:hypothetical protein